jgi:hypothetical protein
MVPFQFRVQQFRYLSSTSVRRKHGQVPLSVPLFLALPLPPTKPPTKKKLCFIFFFFCLYDTTSLEDHCHSWSCPC